MWLGFAGTFTNFEAFDELQVLDDGDTFFIILMRETGYKKEQFTNRKERDERYYFLMECLTC